MPIGVKRGTVFVQPHEYEWEIAAVEIINKLECILKDDVIDVQHIGSTSIKNICAKPIIDIVVGVNSFDKMIAHNEELLADGIVYRGEDHPGQLLYVCGNMEKNIQTHFIHVVIYGEKQWNDYLNMRDYLNANQEKAKEYSDLKERLANEYAEDRKSYTKGKGALIENILQEARDWRNMNSGR